MQDTVVKPLYDGLKYIAMINLHLHIENKVCFLVMNGALSYFKFNDNGFINCLSRSSFLTNCSF